MQDFSPQVAALSPQVAVPTDAGGDATPVAEGGLSTPIAGDDGVKTPLADYQGSEGDSLEPVKEEIGESEVKTDVGVSVSYSSTDAVYPPWCASESETAKPKSKPESKLPYFFEGEC